MTRAEHVKYCKDRALEILDETGDGPQAFASMIQDLREHDETKNHIGIQLGMSQMLMPGFMAVPSMRKWIEDFS